LVDSPSRLKAELQTSGNNHATQAKFCGETWNEVDFSAKWRCLGDGFAELPFPSNIMRAFLARFPPTIGDLWFALRIILPPL
jgi:hypothetical protein